MATLLNGARLLLGGCLVAVGTVGCNDSLAPKEVERPAARAEAQPSWKTEIDFEAFEVGKPPPGFTVALTGGGGEPSWVVVSDPSAPGGKKRLAQTSADGTNKRYPVCVLGDRTAKDVDVSVRFKPVSGKVDQAAGLVWRYRDKDNYYVVRANALEDNVVLYKTQNGARTDLKVKGKTSGYGVKADVPQGAWGTLKVSDERGNLHVVSLNDTPLFEVVDDTFADAGKVGLWTKADSVTHFDDLVINGYDPK